MADTTPKRPRLIPLACIALSVLSTACDGSSPLTHAFNGVRLSAPVSKPAVVWQRADGASYDIARETAGRVTLLYFGYTHCPDVCPVQLMNLGTALRTLGADTTAMVRVLFVTLDPARDTSEILRNWLQGFHRDFIPLRGPLSEVKAEVNRLKLVPASPEDSTGTPVGPSHASAIVAFGRDGLAHFF